jgi:hypothetical protein
LLHEADLKHTQNWQLGEELNDDFTLATTSAGTPGSDSRRSERVADPAGDHHQTLRHGNKRYPSARLTAAAAGEQSFLHIASRWGGGPVPKVHASEGATATQKLPNDWDSFEMPLENAPFARTPHRILKSPRSGCAELNGRNGAPRSVNYYLAVP